MPPFRLTETAGAFKHYALGWRRLIFRQSADFFIERYQASGVQASRAAHLVDQQDKRQEQPLKPICHICGYAIMQVEINKEWIIETCSAMPMIESFESPRFTKWCSQLNDESLPSINQDHILQK